MGKKERLGLSSSTHSQGAHRPHWISSVRPLLCRREIRCEFPRAEIAVAEEQAKATRLISAAARTRCAADAGLHGADLPPHFASISDCKGVNKRQAAVDEGDALGVARLNQYIRNRDTLGLEPSQNELEALRIVSVSLVGGTTSTAAGLENECGDVADSLDAASS